jgi:penicillin-binding protein 1B
MEKRSKIKIIIACIAGLFFLLALGVALWATQLNATIKERLAGKRWSAPAEFYAAPERFLKGQSQISKTLTETLARLDYQKVISDQPLKPGEYSQWPSDLCRQKITEGVPAEVTLCWAIRPRERHDQKAAVADRPLQVLAVSADDFILDVFEGEPPKPIPVVELEPELFAQFYAGQPVLREIISLGDIPPYLLNAIMAIEDADFLNHHGVSFTGIVRAALRNLVKGHVAEGGSTLTQQLIKNYFLTSERTFRRKITEILMALLLESQFSKDEILETYINEVYLGQEGPFEVHGVAAAAKYILGKRPENLTLAESALLAGSIRGPNNYSFVTHSQKALTRRNAVLKRMVELRLIDIAEYTEATREPLPLQRQRLLRDLAPFFVDSVKYELQKLKLPEPTGLQVYTTLNMRAQAAATEALTNGITQLEKQYVSVQKREKKYNQKLQGVLIAADPTNGFVEAVVGGRSYGETQLNRALQSKRQVGSVFKPFVYLTAFNSVDQNGAPYTPLTNILDEEFTVTYDRQSWTPHNFDEKYEGNVTLYHALEESLNAATSKIALQVGIKNIIEVAHKAGIDSQLKAFPSLALGAADLSPFEVLQSYSTLARRGEFNPLTFIYKVLTPTKEILYEFKPTRVQALDPIQTRQTISLMEGVLDRGTGRSIRSSGFLHPAAGKTGTTSDTKDAWFAGFTPLHAAVVWVGFDKPEPTGLTGALGAIPIWTSYMKAYASRYPPIDFAVPEGAVKVDIDPETAMTVSPHCPHFISLVFKKGTEPTMQCSLHR